MSAHFDGGAEIAGRRLREVEVSYVDDPTLDMGAEDSDDCPASPPPTYYLRVREEKRSAGRAAAESGSSSGSDSCDGQSNKSNKKWSWRYVNVEKKCLLVWDRRGGRLLRSIPLKDVESLVVLPDQDAPASILEVYISSPAPNANVGCRNSNISKHDTRNDGGVGGGDSSNGHEGPHEQEEDDARWQRERQQGNSRGEGLRDGERVDGGVLVLQARSRRETLLWAKVLQENVELMTKRRVPLENRDEETSLSDVQQLAKLLTHQLSELQRGEDGGGGRGNQHATKQRESSSATLTAANASTNGSIPEGVEDGETEG